VTITNRYQGTCLCCRKTVQAGQGLAIKVDGKWSIYHTGCAPGGAAPEPRQTSAPDATITLRHVGDKIQVRPAGYLGPDLFEAYRAACGGADYSRTERCNYAGVDLVGAIVTRLVAAGFKLDVDPGVTAAVQSWEARAKADTEAATGRAAEIDAKLRERGIALFPFQVQGVSWLAPLDRAILSDDMGCGKTLQSLASLPDRAPILVVGPAVAKGVWARECARWRPDLKVTILSGRRSFRWPVAGEIVVTNYDVLPDAPLDSAERGRRAKVEQKLADARKIGADTAKYEEQLASDDGAIELMNAAPAGLCVIADEAHAVKGARKKVARCAKFGAIADAAYDVAKGRVWLLTATPLLNRPTELWNLLSLIRSQKVVFGSYPNFKKLCGGYDTGFGTSWSAGGIAGSVGDKLRQVMLRRMKVDVLDQLPAKTVEVIDVELDSATIKRLDAIRAELAERGIDLDAAIKAAASNQSIAFEEIARARAILATAKTAAAMDLANDMEEAGEPVVVFSAHRAPVDALAQRDGWASITGDTAPAERTKIEERFQRGELRGIGGTIKASGVAITLTRASNAVFVDSEWTPKLNEQAEDRIYRIGQAKPVRIVYLRAKHPIDERVFELCAIKQGMVARTVDAAAHRDGPLAERTDAAAAMEAARAGAAGTAKRDADNAALADKVRAARVFAEADKVRRHAAVKAENANRNRGWSIDPALFETPPRAAETPAEEWAVRSLTQLTAMDGDHAWEENGVGFNKADTYVGQALAAAAVAGQLSTGEWICAIKLLRKYEGQIGAVPA
jgi:hypothetical protein